MKLTESTIVSFPVEVGVEPDSVRFFENIEQAAYSTGVSPDYIKRAVKNHSKDRYGYSWYMASEVITISRGLVELGIKTKEWFNNCFSIFGLNI